MRILEVKVNDQDLPKLKLFLEHIDFVKEVRELNNDQSGVDEITLASQASLAEDWDSEEDERYEGFYNNKESSPSKNNL